jgi:hypothetical protein
LYREEILKIQGLSKNNGNPISYSQAEEMYKSKASPSVKANYKATTDKAKDNLEKAKFIFETEKAEVKKKVEAWKEDGDAGAVGQ